MKQLFDKIDKQSIAALPRVVFPGRVIVIQSEGEAERAVDYLLSKPILGLDTETRPSFKKGMSNMVALLQVSTIDTCFLFRLNMIGLSKAIIRLLEDKHVPKVGLSLKDDMLMMSHRATFKPGYFIELQQFVKQFGIEDMSLQKLYANVFGEKISKGQRLSNWEADVLSEAQKLYAATDAWACIMLYEQLCYLRESGSYQIVHLETEPSETKNPEPEK
jgi:ribonuclease D